MSTPSAWPPAPFVSADWLAAAVQSGRTDLCVVDCRYSFDPAVTGTGEEMYRLGHIPSAVYLDWTTAISAPFAETGVQWMLAPPAQFAAAMTEMGITNSTVVVAYDHEGGHYAARLWWALRYYGHDACLVLHGGIQAWQSADLPLETDSTADVHAAVPFQPASPRHRVRATADEVQVHLNDPAVVLLDVRRPTEFDGGEQRAARRGHIPNSRSLFWRTNLNWAADAGGAASGVGDDTRTLRPQDELKARYAEASVLPDRRVIAYCQGGVRAAHTALVLHVLGYPDVAVYDGSWEEWGNDPARPIA